MHRKPCHFTYTHLSSFKTGRNLRRRVIVISVHPVKQVIYFFFISLKLCNSEQYRMWHWRWLSLSHLWISNPFFCAQHILRPSNKYRVVINSFMHAFLICCHKSCLLSLEHFNVFNLKPHWFEFGCFLQQNFIAGEVS